jgi:photosynthetic reaction center cytochrome c subunit
MVRWADRSCCKQAVNETSLPLRQWHISMVQSVKVRWGLFGGLLALMVFLLVAVVAVLSWFDRSQKPDPVQTGYRGTGMAQLYSDETLRTQALLQAPPPIASAARSRPNGPVAGKVYKNVQVLGDLPLGEFGRTMTEITNWISPKESCVYCHVEGNFVADDKYTKVVARRMFQMVQQINANWKSHVAGTGVTCYTCHRGNGLPAQRWFRQLPPAPGADFAGGKQIPHQVQVRGLALPSDPMGTFLLSDVAAPSVRVMSPRVLAQVVGQPIQQAEQTYALMMHVSQSLGVNCSFCHNTRSFAAWPESSPQRQTAWYGIRMVRDINSQFLEPLSSAFPASAPGRLGPAGDAAKVNCATCHLGANKPLFGAQMAKYYPALLLAPPAALAPEAAASAAEPAPDAAAAAAAMEAAASAAARAMAAASAPPAVIAAATAALSRSAAPAPVALPAPVPASVAVAKVASAPAAVLVAKAASVPAAVVVAKVASAPAAVVVAKVASAPAAPAVVKPAPGPSLPAVTVVQGVPPGGNCAALDAMAGKAGVPVAASLAQRRVTGTGRLQFYTAPASTCVMPGIFILSNEKVKAYADHAGYMLVKYVNPRTGVEVTGWVQTGRLAPD